MDLVSIAPCNAGRGDIALDGIAIGKLVVRNRLAGRVAQSHLQVAPLCDLGIDVELCAIKGQQPHDGTVWSRAVCTPSR